MKTYDVVVVYKDRQDKNAKRRNLKEARLKNHSSR